MRVRVGAGGGIGCPEAAAAAFAMGADFVLTGTINQMSRQAGTCVTVRKQLSQATYSDIAMAPAADMFDEGVQLQVLKKGTMFPGRAKNLYELFVKYPSLEALPAEVQKRLEKTVFRKPIATVWEETVDFTLNALKDPEKVARAEKDPKLKMSLVFRWYLGQSSAWANYGVDDRALDYQARRAPAAIRTTARAPTPPLPSPRPRAPLTARSDYQVWCGPAIGSFNDFIRGSYLDSNVSGVFHDVHEANLQLLRGACLIRRIEELQSDPRARRAVDAAALVPYRPERFNA